MYKLEIKRWNRNLRIPESYIFTCENITFFFIYFHILTQNRDCGYLSEPPRRGGSNVHPQSMF